MRMTAAPPLASWIGLVVTFLVAALIQRLADRPRLGGLVSTFPAKIPATLLATLLAGAPLVGIRTSQSAPYGLAAVAVFAAGAAWGATRGPRMAFLAGALLWVALVAPAAFLETPGFVGGTLVFLVAWGLALAFVHARAWQGEPEGAPHATRRGGARGLTRALVPALIVFAALWAQPHVGDVLAAAITVLPVNVTTALVTHRHHPARMRTAMRASIANLLSSLAFVAAFLGTLAFAGMGTATFVAGVVVGIGAAIGCTFVVDRALRRAER